MTVWNGWPGTGEYPPGRVDPDIAPLQTFVAAKLYFHELLQIVVPMTKWWYEPRTMRKYERTAPRMTTRSRAATPTVR